MFTQRETEVLELILRGFTNEKIAENLNISKHTVKAHKDNIFRKLEVSNSVQAAVKYLRMKSVARIEE